MNAFVKSLALAAFAMWGVAGAAENVSVVASREAGAVRVTAHAVLRARLATAWQTLTDYERLPDFIPGMHQSTIVAHRGATAIVSQVGEARLAVFTYAIKVTVASVQVPPDEIDVHLLSGNLKKLDGGYRIRPLAGGKLALDWTGLIEPALPLPPLVTEYLMKSNVEDQFLGMVREIERRESLRTAP